jgi:hypothetical protein
VTFTRSLVYATTPYTSHGRGAVTLVRPDQMRCEGSLSGEEAEVCPELYRVLHNTDESEAGRLLCDDDGDG